MSRRANTVLRENLEAEIAQKHSEIKNNEREIRRSSAEIERLVSEQMALQSQLIEVLKNSRRRSKPVNGGAE